MRGHREDTINIIILFFTCSDDKAKQGKFAAAVTAKIILNLHIPAASFRPCNFFG